MIFPENYEEKTGFSEIRTLLKGRCMSTLGTEWVDREVTFQTDPDTIRELLAQAEEFARFRHDEDDVYEENFFDVRQPLLRIRPERSSLEEIELFDLKRSLRTIYALVSFFLKANDDTAESESADVSAHTYPALYRLASKVETFPHIIRRIEDILNKYGKVKDTASTELLSIRHQLEVTARSISYSLRQIINEAQQDGYIDRDVAPTHRDGRLVIPVAPALKRKIRGIIHDESASGKTVFIEPTAVVDANNKMRELKAAEGREVMRILQELTAEIRPLAPAMLDSLHFLARIDYLRALSGFSEAFNAIVPQIKPYPHIDWVQAVHPLLQQSLKRHGAEQIPLDISLRSNQQILLISGPNAGGKSVCLKTVGLLQYMMQCGMPVPMRENSVMGVFQDLLISIGDEQSISNELSTYSSHLLTLKTMMKRSTPRSLILIDELGSGTEPQIGGALAEAILDRFVKNGTYGIITTHFQNLKRFAETLYGVALAFFLVPLGKGRGLRVINGEAFVNRLFVVVSTAGGLAAVDEALHKYVVGHLQLQHGTDFRVALCEHLLQGFGLRNGAWKSVEDNAFARAEAVVYACQNVYHQAVGDELPVIDVAFGGLAQFCAVLDLCAKHVAGGYVLETIFLYEQVALRALSGARCPEDNYIFHWICVSEKLFYDCVDIRKVTAFSIVVETITYNKIVGYFEAAVRNVQVCFKIVRLYQKGGNADVSRLVRFQCFEQLDHGKP